MKKLRIKRSQQKKTFPAPSFLPGMRGSAAWHVRPVELGEIPHTINNAGGEAEMALPPADTPEHKYTRLHELLHAAHSPIEEPRPLLRHDGTWIGVEALLMAEEFRINMVGRALVGGGTYMPTQRDQDLEHAQSLMKMYQATGSGAIAMEFIHWILIVWPYQNATMTDYPEIVAHLLNKGVAITADTEFYELRAMTLETTITIWSTIWDSEIGELTQTGAVPSWDSVLKLAAFLQDVENTVKPPAHSGSTSGGESEDSGEKEDPDIVAARTRADDHLGTRHPTKAPSSSDKIRGLRDKIRRPEFIDDDVVKWGKMRIRKARMAFRLPKNKLRRSKYRPTEEGSNPRYPHRMMSDGKVFSRKRKVPGGSVLIDDSGSMSWTTDQLKDIILNAPASIIAAYSGWGSQGELMIVADNARYADMENPNNHPNGGGNVVDLPALEWLAVQSKPRIWVSDTFVIPVEGGYGPALDECLQLCKDYEINVVFTVEEAGQVFRGEKDIYR